MLALDARFTSLAVLCCLATQSLSPFATTTSVYGAVISRSPEEATSLSRHQVGQGQGDLAAGGHDDSRSTAHTQTLFSFPWTKKGKSDSVKHKVRMMDLHPSNPFERVVDATLSRIQRSRGNHRRPHKSIVIPNQHGDEYIVGHSRRAPAPQWTASPQNGTATNGTDRAETAMDGLSGFVSIRSPGYNSPDDRVVGYLYLINGTDVLDASETNKTEMFLVNAPMTSSSDPVAASSNDSVPVKLCIQGVDPGRPRCATYNPNPPQPEALTMEPSFNGSQVDNKSQIFMYDGQSGVIQPAWSSSQGGGNASAADVPSSSSSSSQEVTSSMNTESWSSRSAASTATSSSISPSSSSALRRSSDNTSASDAPTYARNVTLVFVPTARTPGNATAADVGNSGPEFTSTVTQTVTVYGSGSASSMHAASVTSSAAANITSTSSTGGLNVELVGDGYSTYTSSLTITTSASWTVSSSSSSMFPAPSSSIDAAAVASSIALSASMARASSSSSATSVSSYAAASIPIFSASASSSGVSVTDSASSIPSASSSQGYDAASAPLSSTGANVSVTVSASSSTASDVIPSSSPSPSYVAAVMERNAEPEITPISTDPYFWKFKSEAR